MLKRRLPSARLHDATSQKTTIFTLAAVRNWITSFEQFRFAYLHEKGNNRATCVSSVPPEKHCRTLHGRSVAQKDDKTSGTRHDFPPRLTPCLTYSETYAITSLQTVAVEHDLWQTDLALSDFVTRITPHPEINSVVIAEMTCASEFEEKLIIGVMTHCHAVIRRISFSCGLHLFQIRC
jgi:hypothetical protein